MTTFQKIYVSGHRNPDVDSIAAATALALLRSRQGKTNFQAVCPGIAPEKARKLFEFFHVPLPPQISDIHIRIEHIMENSIPSISEGTPLFDAVEELRASGFPRLPVLDKQGSFRCMLSPVNLLSHLLDIGESSEDGLTSRKVYSSLSLIGRVLKATPVNLVNAEEKRTYLVYVAAMGADSFESHIKAENSRDLMIICGDRPEIHLRALQRKVGCLILTGDRQLDPLILREATELGINVLQTSLDSAAVIRRLKFCAPVEYYLTAAAGDFTLSPHERLHGLEHRILNAPEDILPVLDDNRKYLGAVRKSAVSTPPPFGLIMVDHNEQDQSIPGAKEIPVLEVVDHHRIGMLPTTMPIKFTGDVVGSCCTLVAAMFKSAGESLPAPIAGILLGGLVTDTLLLKSPTTTPQDFKICEWLEKVSGTTARKIMELLSQVDSPLTSQSPEEVIQSDRKSYVDGRFRFSLSQVEETNLVLLQQRKGELEQAMLQILKAEGLQFMGLMVTDAVRENSLLLFVGSNSIRRELPFSPSAMDPQLLELPGILSRKKQLLPRILAITSQFTR